MDESRPLLSGGAGSDTDTVTPLVDGHKSFWHPTGAPFRFMLLVFISFICFGSYFTYDEIEPVGYATNFKGYFITGDTKYGVLYSVYSFPNTVLVFFGGILGDKIGLRLAGLGFVILCVIGSSVVALGSQLIGAITPQNGYIITVIGRFIFGCGAESLNVIQNSMISRWFSDGNQLAFAMGLSLSMCRLGDYFALSGTTYIASWFGNYNYVLWLGAILCGGSLVSVLIYSSIDKATEKYFPNRTVNLEDNELNFKAVLKFDIRFWFISIICMSYYGGIFPFVSICNGYLTSEYKLNEHDAGLLSGIITLSSMILSPFLGKFIDIVQRRPYFVIMGSIAVIPAHLYLAFLLPYPVIPIIVMGLSFSIVPSALWPSIPIIIKPKEVATAFGVMAAIQNAGLAGINALSGVIKDQYGYKGDMYFFVLMDCVGLVFAIILLITDLRKGSALIDKRNAVKFNQPEPIVHESDPYEESPYQQNPYEVKIN